MTALPLRPALADVLSVVVKGEREEFATWLEENAPSTLSVEPAPTGTLGLYQRWPARSGVRAGRGWVMAAKDIAPAEAFETLIARDVLPDSWAGDMRRAFVHTDRPDDGWGDTRDVLTPHPATIPALVSWASLGPAAILRAEELARETVARLRPWGAPQPERVVWCARPLTQQEDDGVGRAWDDDAHDGDHALESGGQSPAGDFVEQAHDVWEMGLVIASITADAVTIVVPPIGGAT